MRALIYKLSPTVGSANATRIVERFLRDITSDPRWTDPYRFAAPKLDRQVVNSALRLGIILSAQLEAWIEWTRGDRFSLGRLHALPDRLEMQDEVIREFKRISISGYVDGVLSTARAGSDPAASLSTKALRNVELHGARLGAAAVHAIRTKLMPVVESAFDTRGQRIKPQEELERELRQVYATFLTTAPRDMLDRALEFAESDPIDAARDRIIEQTITKPARRRMKVRNRTKYEDWQRSRLPFTKWIKQTVEQIQAEAIAPPTLNPRLAVRWVQTERTRFVNRGVIEATINQSAVVGYRFTLGTSESHHPACAAASGMVLRKGDQRLQRYTPPLHHGCKSHLEAVYADERVTFTPRRSLPHPKLIAEGFGRVGSRQ